MMYYTLPCFTSTGNMAPYSLNISKNHPSRCVLLQLYWTAGKLINDALKSDVCPALYQQSVIVQFHSTVFA